MRLCDKDKMHGIILSIIYPLGGLIYSIRNMDKSGTRLCFVLFCLYFGTVFIYHQQGTILGEGSDSERYAIYLKDAHQNRTLNIVNYVKEYNIRGQIDIYAPIMIYTISRFTDNPHIFFAVVALIYGIFYSGFIWMVYRHANQNKSIISVLFLLALILISPIWKINGVRWWTGLFMFCYGTAGYILEHKPVLLLWSVLSVLIHYTFLYPLVVFILFTLLPKKRLLPYFIIFLLINIFNNIDLSYLENFITALFPAKLTDLTTGYLTFEYSADRNLFADSDKYAGLWLNIYLVSVFYLKAGHDIRQNPMLRKMFIFSLMLQTLCLFINIAPWGGRFLNLGDLMLYSFYCMAVSNKKIFCNTIKYLKPAVPFLIFIILMQIKDGFYVISLFNLFLGNYITTFIVEDNISIMNIIDKLLST